MLKTFAVTLDVATVRAFARPMDPSVVGKFVADSVAAGDTCYDVEAMNEEAAIAMAWNRFWSVPVAA